MKKWAVMDADGYPVRAGGSRDVPADAVELPAGFDLGTVGQLRRVGADWVFRPTVSLEEGEAGVRVLDAPAGTTVEARDAGDGSLVLTAESEGNAWVQLPADCDVYLTVTPPRPWLRSERRVRRGAGSAALAAAELTTARTRAIARVNGAVGERRKAFVTDIPAQEMIYLEKRAEALRYLAASPEPETLADYPLLAAEVGITAPTAWQLAQVWANQAAMLVAVAAQLESLRLGTIAAIEAAGTAAAIEAAEGAFLTALSQEL